MSAAQAMDLNTSFIGRVMEKKRTGGYPANNSKTQTQRRLVGPEGLGRLVFFLILVFLFFLASWSLFPEGFLMHPVVHFTWILFIHISILFPFLNFQGWGGCNHGITHVLTRDAVDIYLYCSRTHLSLTSYHDRV